MVVVSAMIINKLHDASVETFAGGINFLKVHLVADSFSIKQMTVLPHRAFQCNGTSSAVFNKKTMSSSNS